MKTPLILACLLAVASLASATTMPMVWNFDSWTYPDSPTTFQSDYTYVNPTYDPGTNTWNFDGNSGGSFWPEGVYGVTSDPHDGHPYWADMSDVSGQGNMLVYNGSPEREIVWSTDVTGIAGERYVFDFWFANVNGTSPADLALHVTGDDPANSNNDLQLPGAVSLPSSDLGNWQHYWWAFQAPSANFTLTFRNLNTDANGNDFAMDDLRLSQAPEPGTFAVTGITLILIGAAFRCRWNRKMRLVRSDIRNN